jgi:hypothetical protein
VKTSLRSLSRSLGWRALAALATAALPALLGACSQTPVTVDLHSLQSSGNVSFVCRGDDNPATGHKLDECPDVEPNTDLVTRRTLGLVTQTATNEVAIVDLVAGAVVDVDPTSPGYSFLRVGARPGAIVTTPGGAASFVGVTGLQKNGIFALPTTCLGAPLPNHAARDLTTWSACALSSAPGDIAVVIDPPASDGTIRESCLAGGTETPPAKQEGRDCPADLTGEGGPKGRRKLLVSLPDEHKLVLLDAQTLLDQSPGDFQPCKVEPLGNGGDAFTLTRIPKVIPQPILPDDLQLAPGVDASVCQKTTYPPPLSTLPTPGGFAQSTDRLYVADRTLPFVHVLDSSQPCAASELDPLSAESYASPNRTVTTSRVAVSPLTPGGKQFVYAVDETDQPTASVMVFDVSPGVANPTPLIFPGAPRQPFVPPDRLQFNSPVKDVSFVMRDFPQSTDTGVGQFGLACDPFPNDPLDEVTCTRPGCLYRSNSDFSSGARPVNLRGAFGFLMLKNGQVVITDVEDFDKPCRRPLSSNASATEDFRGCASDKPAPNQSLPPPFYTADGSAEAVPTVTDESSCHIIETHRPRAATLSISNTTVGLDAPTLRSFPQFSNPDPSAVTSTDKQPRLLGVDFPNPDPNSPPIPAQVNVSAQVYAHCPVLGSDMLALTPQPPPCDKAQALDINPGTAQQNSLVLPLVEPRSYPQQDSPALVFEGRVFPPRSSGFLQLTDASGINPLPPGQALLQDPDANFCAAGVEDSATIVNEADSLAIPKNAQGPWALKHADYAQITGDFPGVDDTYWSHGAGMACPRDRCENEFGNIDNPEVLSVSRDLSILEARGNQLLVSPRCQSADGTPDASCDPVAVLNDIRCCFPTGTAYTVRASHQWLLGSLNGGAFSSGRNDLATGADGRCVHTASCDPRKKYFHVRAFEACDQTSLGKDCDTDDNVGCTVPGVRVVPDGPLVPGVPVEPGRAGSSCIFENLTARFVVYRGGKPSTRGMSFSWQTTGGFVPLFMSLSTQSTQVSPQSMSFLPGYGYLAVVDASTLGLSLFDLNSLAVVAPSPYF